MIWNIMTMRTHLPIMGHLDSTMTIIDVLTMVVMNCLIIIIIELNQIILLESSWVSPNLWDVKTLMHTLEWEEQFNQICRVHDLSYRRRVNLASVELSGYALTWWNQIQEIQLVMGRAHIDTWVEMKQVMRRRFVPWSYQCDLHNRLQNLRQGTKSVDDYYKEMALLLIRFGVR
jgi:hypothetical protein